MKYMVFRLLALLVLLGLTTFLLWRQGNNILTDVTWFVGFFVGLLWRNHDS